MADVASETTRRFELWKTLSKERLDNLEPAQHRELSTLAALRAFGSIKLAPRAQR